MKAVYCDWPECEYWERDVGLLVEGRCTKETIRMYRDPVKSTIKGPPTCSWYTERKDEDK